MRFISSVLAGGLVASRLASGLWAQPAFVPHACAGRASNPRVVCGTVTVAEKPDAAGGRSIPLNVAVVRAAHPRQGAPPLFHLEGGPGLGASSVAGFYLGPGASYADTRDVVLVDQRGTGQSAALRCGAIERRPAWEDEYTAEDAAACSRELSAHADLTQYTTEHAARDLDRVREALGAPSIDVWALSYGTRLAQVYMKRFPSRVHAAVLVGFAPLDYRTPLFHAVNAQRVLDLIFYECQRDSSCAERYPQLREEWNAVLRRVDAGPIRLMVQDSAVALGRGRFGELFRNTLTSAAGQRAAPAVIHAAAHGDFAPFAAAAAGSSPAVAEGLYLSIVCTEAVPRIPRDASAATAGTFLGDYRVSQERLACSAWPRAELPADFYDPPRTSIPLLVLSGSMDGVTTPDWARQFCSETAGCTFVSIPDLGHGPFDLGAWTEGDCFDRVATQFFEDPAQFDAACVAQMKPPPFKEP
jgi:pimeloyl-ACP methyl ester carboxylesterase